LRSGDGFRNDFDLLVPIGAGEIEGAEDDRFPGDEDGGAVQSGLVEDRVRDANGGLLVGHGGLRDPSAQAGAIGIAVECRFDLQPYILILNVRMLWPAG
jgi:hypothetical protein